MSIDRTLALQRLENLLASKHCVLETLLATISDLTAFWHLRCTNAHLLFNYYVLVYLLT